MDQHPKNRPVDWTGRPKHIHDVWPGDTKTSELHGLWLREEFVSSSWYCPNRAGWSVYFVEADDYQA